MKKLLAQEYPMTTFEVIVADIAIQEDETIETIAGEEYDAVIVGNAA